MGGQHDGGDAVELGTTEEVANEEVGPFGNPDGARAGIDDMLRHFVDFSGRTGYGALATRAEDSSARVIVGRLGAGKTVYLRRLQSYQAKKEGVYADEFQQSLPSTELIVRVGQMFPEQYLTEKWMQIWHRAILRSLATHLLHHKDLRPYLDTEMRRALEKDYQRLLGDATRPRSVYSAVRSIVNDSHSAIDLTKYLEHDRWDDLEFDLGEALREAPPVYFYLDAVDDEFHHAPMYWLRCQKGLFYQAMRLLRDAKMGGRLHIVICVRDVVMSSVYQSEHAPRYHGEPHIRVLNWSVEALEFFLAQKIAGLSPNYRMSPNRDKSPIRQWLGTDMIRNERRDTDEKLVDYLIRHTRLIPRDVVALGNALSHEVERYKSAGESRLSDSVIRDTVARCAARFGESQISQCANQLSADLMPPKAYAHGYSHTYVGSEEYTVGLKDQLSELLAGVGVDRFDHGTLQELEERATATFGADAPANLGSILWQNGILGYVGDGGPHFYRVGDTDAFKIPQGASTYLLHPCLIDAVPGIRSVGAEPVYPYPRRSSV
jgi:hypothetical protein